MVLGLAAFLFGWLLFWGFFFGWRFFNYIVGMSIICKADEKKSHIASVITRLGITSIKTLV